VIEKGKLKELPLWRSNLQRENTYHESGKKGEKVDSSGIDI
jgi:hypothetical protein